MKRLASPVASCGFALALGLALTLAAPESHAQSAPVGPAGTELGAIRVRERIPVPVHFLAYRGEDQYTVQAQNQQCNTPCTLVLTSGPASAHATGTGELTAQFVVPHMPAQVRLSHGAPGWYLPAGAVLVPAGIVVGGAFWAFGLTCGYSSGSGGCTAAHFITWPVLGVAMLITGSVLLGSANRGSPVDANRVEILDARARPRVRFTDFALAPTGNGGFSGAAAFTF